MGHLYIEKARCVRMIIESGHDLTCSILFLTKTIVQICAQRQKRIVVLTPKDKCINLIIVNNLLKGRCMNDGYDKGNGCIPDKRIGADGSRI